MWVIYLALQNDIAPFRGNFLWTDFRLYKSRQPRFSSVHYLSVKFCGVDMKVIQLHKYFIPFVLFLASTVAHAAQVRTEKPVHVQDEDVVVRFSNLVADDDNWITIVSAGTADSQWAEWYYISPSNGTQTFTNNLAPGEYEVRLYYNFL